MLEPITTGDGIATLTIEGDVMLEEIAEAKGIVVVEDARTDERTNKEIVARLGNRTIVNVPIFLHDKQFGSVGTGTYQDEGVRPPTGSEREYLTAAANHLAVALDRIHLLTERKQAEEAIGKANLYNRSLIEASIDPLVTIGPDGKITDVNKATETVTGVTRDRLIGDDFSNYFSEPERAGQGYKKVLAEGMVRDYPLTIRHTSGKTTAVLYNATVYKNETGEIQGVFAAARDMTEYRKVEAEREQYFKFFQTSNDMMCIADPNGAFMKTNPACSQMLGYSESELISRPFIEFVHPEDKQPTLDEMARQIQKGFSLNFENRYLCKDGSYRWLSWRANYIQSEGLTYATARDITEKKLAEEELRSAALYSRSLIEASVDPLITISPDGKITDVNQATETVTGVSRQRLIDTDFSNYFTEPGKAREGYEKVLKEGMVRDYPLTICHETGIKTEVHYNATVYRDAAGNIQGVFAAARDITERKQNEQKLLKSEAKYRSLVEQMPSVVYLIPLKSTDQEYYLSPQIRQIGYTSEEVLADLTLWRKLIHPDDRSRVASFDHHFVSDKTISDEYRFFTRAGQMIWVHEDYWTVRDGTGQPIYIQGICSDITNRKQAEEKLHATLEEKETLLREVHHRVKNNLQAMIALMDMQAKSIQDVKAKQFLKDLEGQARTMSLVYEQLYQSENLSRVEMRPYIQQLTTNILQAFGTEKRIDLKLDTSISLDVAEAMPCGLIINELVTNAVKHAFPHDFKKQPVIEIDLHNEGSTCHLTVRDNGMGLPPEHDWRSSRTLGLRLVNLWATHQLGGTLDVPAKPGTTFIINFEIETEK